MQRCHIAQWARWIKAFREGRDTVQDNLRTGRPHVENNTVHLLASLLRADRRCTARELAADVGVSHKTVLHILREILGYRLQRVGYAMKFPRCNNSTAMQSHIPCLIGA